MGNIKGDPLDLLLRIQQAQAGEDYGTGLFTRSRGVGFSVGNDRLVMPLASINEIATVAEIAPVPMTREWVLGVSNIRGNVVTVVDLAGYLGLGIRPIRGSIQVIVINARGFRTALRVSTIFGLRLLPDDSAGETIDDRAQLHEQLRSLVTRVFQLEEDADDSLWGEFDLRALIARDDFMNVAQEQVA